MFIRNCLTETRELTTLNGKQKIDEALGILKDKKLKSVPVIDDNGKFLGILSKERLFEELENGVAGTVAELKTKKVSETVNEIKPLHLDSKFEETLPIIVRFPFVPIVNEDMHLLGIVKRKEITLALESSFGVGVPGVRLLIGTAEMEGRLEKILDATHQLYINVISAIAFDAGEQFNRRVLLKVEKTDKKDELIEKLEKNGFTILTVHED